MNYKFFKRLFDLTLGIIALPFFILFLVIIAPIIYFEDRGTIFYNAYRMGKDGKIFTMYKLRSMKVDAPDLRNEDGSTFNAENDQRLTKIGKLIRETSLDELPQIINIIKGDMSIIGPRPDLPEHEAFYENNEHRKLEIRPGLTGYNQAYFRNTIQWKDRIKNDIYYIDNMSAWMDLKIFFKTVKSVICRKDVFIKNNDESKNGDKNNVK